MRPSASVSSDTTAPHVLVVDDDRRLRELLTRFLREHGFRVTAAHSSDDARKKSMLFAFDALVLDIMMPGQDGFEYAREVREDSMVPILMLTARSDLADRIRGLEIGADDYLAKPFDPRELMLRLNNILKRSSPAATTEIAEPDSIRFGPYTFGFVRGDLRRNGDPVRISEREKDILTILGKRAGAEVYREELAGGDNESNERTVDVQINRLRRKIEEDPANPLYLQTVRGKGYRLVVDRQGNGNL
ncbi:MAG: response regulator transcription factor [Methylobacteriaceae bacterium]|nr:response regulator transcription factor [Methylobacteriaceae bacterium]